MQYETVKEQEIREAFADVVENDRHLKSIYNKISRGIATYEDADLFAMKVGKALANVFSDSIVTFDEDALRIVKGMLTQNNDLVSAVCEEVQTGLNKAAGVGIKPIKPNNARQVDRIGGIIEAVTNRPTEEALVMLNQNTENLVVSLVDAYVKTNADFQAAAGLNPVIVRKWDGVTGSHDTRHTDWCSSLEGTYDYGNEPKNVFRRHRGCGCLVSYFPNRKAKGVITSLAKGQKDTNGVLRKATYNEAIQKVLTAGW